MGQRGEAGRGGEVEEWGSGERSEITVNGEVGVGAREVCVGEWDLRERDRDNLLLAAPFASGCKNCNPDR